MKHSPFLALVTGATAGFGEAITRRLIQDGHRVIGVARRADRLDALSRDLGSSFYSLRVDVADTSAVDAALSSLAPGWNEVDVLVNNAGLALGLEPAYQAHLPDWERMVKVNIHGVLHFTHALLPGMVTRNRGHIVNLGSVAGEFPYPGGNVYGATKAFLRQFSLNLRADLVGKSVRVTDIEPGLCGGTEFSQVRFRGDQKKADAVYAGTEPLTSEDIAETVSWILHLPQRVNVNTISLMPIDQGFGPFSIHRR